MSPPLIEATDLRVSFGPPARRIISMTHPSDGAKPRCNGALLAARNRDFALEGGIAPGGLFGSVGLSRSLWLRNRLRHKQCLTARNLVERGTAARTITST